MSAPALIGTGIGSTGTIGTRLGGFDSGGNPDLLQGEGTAATLSGPLNSPGAIKANGALLAPPQSFLANWQAQLASIESCLTDVQLATPSSEETSAATVPGFTKLVSILSPGLDAALPMKLSDDPTHGGHGVLASISSLHTKCKGESSRIHLGYATGTPRRQFMRSESQSGDASVPASLLSLDVVLPSSSPQVRTELQPIDSTISRTSDLAKSLQPAGASNPLAASPSPIGPANGAGQTSIPAATTAGNAPGFSDDHLDSSSPFSGDDAPPVAGLQHSVSQTQVSLKNPIPSELPDHDPVNSSMTTAENSTEPSPGHVLSSSENRDNPSTSVHSAKQGLDETPAIGPMARSIVSSSPIQVSSQSSGPDIPAPSSTAPMLQQSTHLMSDDRIAMRGNTVSQPIDVPVARTEPALPGTSPAKAPSDLTATGFIKRSDGVTPAIREQQPRVDAAVSPLSQRPADSAGIHTEAEAPATQESDQQLPTGLRGEQPAQFHRSGFQSLKDTLRSPSPAPATDSSTANLPVGNNKQTATSSPSLDVEVSETSSPISQPPRELRRTARKFVPELQAHSQNPVQTAGIAPLKEGPTLTPVLGSPITRAGGMADNGAVQTASAPNPSPDAAFTALDAETRSQRSGWIPAAPSHAEAGYHDPTLGWVGVRADGSRGEVHATVLPASSEAAQALGSHMAGLHAYLAGAHSPVQTLSLSAPEGMEAASGRAQNSSSDMQQSMGQHQGHAQDHAGAYRPLESPPSSLAETVAPTASILAPESSGRHVGLAEDYGIHISVIA